MKKKYEDYTIDELVCDNDFINWALNSTPIQNSDFDQLLKNPIKKQTIEEAKKLVLILQQSDNNFDNSTITEKAWKNISSDIATSKTVVISFYRYAGVAAACIVLLLGLFFLFNPKPKVASEGWTTIENTTKTAKSILLSDGSSVVLEPMSSLSYPIPLSDKKREVQLNGKAFFSITRDTSRPFFVFAEETVTKVLGTSFTINAFPENDQIEVNVKTGKVAVYASHDVQKISSNKLWSDKTDKSIQKIEVTPNQTATYIPNKDILEKVVSTETEVLKNKKELSSLKYENKSVVIVLEALQEAYGINIDFNKQELINCSISTEIGKLPLPVQMQIIAKAIGVEITEKNATYLIKGNGCK